MCLLCVEYNKGLMSWTEMKDAVKEQYTADIIEDYHNNIDVIEALAEEDEGLN